MKPSVFRITESLNLVENGYDIYEALKHFNDDFLLALSSLCCEIVRQREYEETLNHKIKKVIEELKK